MSDNNNNNDNNGQQQQQQSNETTINQNKEKEEEFSEYQQMICSIIPPLRPELHKGQAGRIGIIGGSREYTGAPYFSAISSMKTGADISFVFCSSESSTVIKSYSPELIVYPVLDDVNFLNEFNKVLPRLHVLIIGPGLGRNEQILSNVGTIITQVKEYNLPIILDADALYFLSKCPDIIRGYTSAILTPNAAEFDRLYTAVFRSDDQSSIIKNNNDDIKNSVELLAKTLGNITILRKGHNDIITDGKITKISHEIGSLRRCGGQGDLLCGTLGTFTYWCHKAYQSTNNNNNRNSLFQNYTPTILACIAASMLTKRCSKLAFEKYSRSMTTSDMIKEIKNAFTHLFPVD